MLLDLVRLVLLAFLVTLGVMLGARPSVAGGFVVGLEVVLVNVALVKTVEEEDAEDGHAQAGL